MKIKLTSVSPSGEKEELGVSEQVERFEAKFASGYYVTSKDKFGRTVKVTLTKTDNGLVKEYPNGYMIVGEIVQCSI